MQVRSAYMKVILSAAKKKNVNYCIVLAEMNKFVSTFFSSPCLSFLQKKVHIYYYVSDWLFSVFHIHLSFSKEPNMGQGW